MIYIFYVLIKTCFPGKYSGNPEFGREVSKEWPIIALPRIWTRVLIFKWSSQELNHLVQSLGWYGSLFIILKKERKKLWLLKLFEACYNNRTWFLVLYSLFHALVLLQFFNANFQKLNYFKIYILTVNSQIFSIFYSLFTCWEFFYSDNLFYCLFIMFQMLQFVRSYINY